MYAPLFPPFGTDAAGWQGFVFEELNRISRAQYDPRDILSFNALAAAPSRPRIGMVAYANGINWNPGRGAGLYFYSTEWNSVVSVGSGGTVTQATNKATGVTLNKQTGEITLNNAALAAGTVVSFTLTNSAITAKDVLVLNHVSGGTLGEYGLNAACAAGSAVIYVRNNSAGSLSEALVLRFTRLPGATS